MKHRRLKGSPVTITRTACQVPNQHRVPGSRQDTGGTVVGVGVGGSSQTHEQDPLGVVNNSNHFDESCCHTLFYFILTATQTERDPVIPNFQARKLRLREAKCFSCDHRTWKWLKPESAGSEPLPHTALSQDDPSPDFSLTSCRASFCPHPVATLLGCCGCFDNILTCSAAEPIKTV